MTGSSAISAGQKGKTVVQTAEDLLDRQDAGPHRRQLDREWQTVEPSAGGRPPHARVAQLEMPRAAPLREQHDGLFCCSGRRSPSRFLR
jgi:hypothetical protein